MNKKIYIKKSIEIVATLFEKPEDIPDIVRWINSNIDLVAYGSDNDSIAIRTLEGTMYASLGDYIIRGVEGEFYPCKPEIFKKTYYDPYDSSPFQY